MNLKNKKTVLNDDAALYSHKEDISEKENGALCQIRSVGNTLQTTIWQK